MSHEFILRKREMIHFDREFNPYGELSNFYSCKLVYQGKSYATAEHVYQARKFLHDGATEYADEIRMASTPFKAKLLGNRQHLYQYDWQRKLNDLMDAHPVSCNPDWTSIKVDVMREVLQLKFTQCQHCRSVLLGTASAPLVEHSRDAFWGDGLKDGANHLGRLLEELRVQIN